MHEQDFSDQLNSPMGCENIYHNAKIMKRVYDSSSDFKEDFQKYDNLKEQSTLFHSFTDKLTAWHIVVRIIESRDLVDEILRVRASINDQHRSTRACLPGNRIWGQSLAFTFPDCTLAKLSEQTLHLEVTKTGNLCEHSLGFCDIPISRVTAESNRRVVCKWIGLKKLSENDESDGDHYGFLRISIIIHNVHEMQPIISDSDLSEEVWHTEDIENYCLRIRVLRLQQPSENFKQLFYSDVDKRTFETLYLRISLGKQSINSSPIQASEIAKGGVFNVDQDLFIPITWPTVISKVHFSLVGESGKRFVNLAESYLELQDIYDAGENGFMPVYGPSFINFDIISKNLNIPNYAFRLFCSIETVNYNEDLILQRAFVQPPCLYRVDNEQLASYNLYCAFYACNMVNPIFGSSNISFHVSMGDYGNTSLKKLKASCGTLGAMPCTDDHKFFYMPWGNHKPVAEFQCVWENIEHRMHRCNALMKVECMLSEAMQLINKKGQSSSCLSASLLIDTLDKMKSILIQLGNESFNVNNELDRRKELSRIYLMKELVSELELFRFALLDDVDDATEYSIYLLNRWRIIVCKLSKDVQLSLPDICVKMVADGTVVGVATIPINEILYHNIPVYRGEYCGKVRQVHVQWISSSLRKNRREEFAAILHVRVWFGQTEYRKELIEMAQPAEIKQFLEIHQIQKRNLNSWKKCQPDLTDEYGNESMVSMSNGRIEGCRILSSWALRTSQDMWISAQSTGRSSVIDRAYEVQERINKEWIAHSYRNFPGARKECELPKALDGWKYEGEWIKDEHMNLGDDEGWVYSMENDFCDQSRCLNIYDRACYHFRRRCIMRRRREIDYHTELSDINAYFKSIGDRGWEYARSFQFAWHCTETSNDKVRRRRGLMEVNFKEISDIKKFSPRVFEVHQATTTWQLRCYIFWAKDLMTFSKEINSIVIRVSFLHRTQQTIAVRPSQNPKWCESLIFDRIPIPGGKQEINFNSQSIYIEVRGERSDNSEVFLGSFVAHPIVIKSPLDSRAIPEWNSFHYSETKTKGALLASFELFSQDQGSDSLPLLPMTKTNQDRYDVPVEIKPSLIKYTIQFFCYGLRNTGIFNLQQVRKPYIELEIGETVVQTEVLKNIKCDPNFQVPLLILPEIFLPSALEMSPPIILNLYDIRSFQRRKLIGCCKIQKIAKYISSKSVEETIEKLNCNWSDYDNAMHAELAYENKYLSTKITSSFNNNYPIDWWSRYYASQGFFDKAPGFRESGTDYLTILQTSLENHAEYNSFNDFLDTFTFFQNNNDFCSNIIDGEKTGELKGKLFISKAEKSILKPPVEFSGPVKCLIRLYVIEAKDLVSTKTNGSINPYLLIQCGDNKISMRNNYQKDTNNPIFGQLFEFHVTIPVEKDLCISIMDRRKLLSDNEIGSTIIDFENRLLTKWRATAGLPSRYNPLEKNAWRDQITPMEILKRYCEKMNLTPPEILSSCEDVGLKFLAIEVWYSRIQKYMNIQDDSQDTHLREQYLVSNGVTSERIDMETNIIADLLRAKSKCKMKENEIKAQRQKCRDEGLGRPLQCVALHILNMMGLVPEHVETRNVFKKMTGNQPCGQLRMFLDIFPIELGPIPSAISISPRKAELYEFRVCIFNVANSIPRRHNFGQPISDLYLKVFMNGSTEQEKTDVHYRCIDGCAEFNWRFVFDISFDPWEQKLLQSKKSSILGDTKEELMDPIMHVEIWDKLKFSKDIKLGEMLFDIKDFQEGLSTPDQCFYSKRRRKRCRMMCRQLTSCPGRDKVCRSSKAPIYVKSNLLQSISIFETGVCRGWWPVVSRDVTEHYQIKKKMSRKKKNDDYNSKQFFITGYVEMEMSILPKDEARQDPVGKKRNEPNHSPFLPNPYRSTWNLFWISSRVKPLLHWCCHSFGPQMVFWIILFILFLFSAYALLSNLLTVLKRAIL